MDDAASAPGKLLAEMACLRARPCSDCAQPICGHEAVISIVLGYKDAARCLPCLATALADGVATLRDHVVQHIRHRDCYLRVWLAASAHEGFGPAVHPPCLFESDGHPDREMRREWPMVSNASGDAPAADAQWDAGDMGCGELVLELRLRLKVMASGSILELTARDPGAPEDLPAWCRMTGHTLLKAQHPQYWIKRKEE